MTLGKVYHFKAGNLFSILTCHTHGGAGVIFIPGRCGILLCNIWPEKGRLLLWGFPVGRSMLDVFMGLVHRQCCHGGAVGWPWSHSTAEPCWSISPLLSRGLPALPFQLLHTRVQGKSCSLKVAQAEHKTQLKVLTKDCTY